MKVSLNEIKKYVQIPASVTTAELLQRIGSRLVEVEGVEDWSEKYRNIYIVKVVKCEPIPDTHLHLCQIEAGQAEPVQVVCGAPNVHAGMLAVWIAPGAIVPETYGEENFEISTRKMRGFESHGMLAAADELALGDDHAGIVEIDPHSAQAGDSFAEKFDLNDLILDIENKSLTHRPDCFGLIGFAREVAGILGVPFTEPAIFSESLAAGVEAGVATDATSVKASAKSTKSADAEEQTAAKSAPTLAQQLAQAGLKPEAKAGDLQVKITDAKLCPRYAAAVLDYEQAPRSKYLTPGDVFLAKAGMRSVSPIVDLTNILMLQTGQPLHAFDYDKLAQICGGAVQIVVRAARAGEELQLLDGKTISCTANDILICAGDTPVALAGAMGGASTAIDASTRRIVLESATFSLYHLRKTQMAHGIFSEAITRFTKGQPAWLVTPVLVAAVKQSGAQLVTAAEDYAAPESPVTIQIATGEINGLLGTHYSHQEIEETLEHVGFTVAHCEPSLETPATTFRITVPAWRTDVKIKEDLIEEVGRLLGYDNITPTFPQRDFAGAQGDPLFTLKAQVRQILAGDAGAHEVLTYSFVSEQLLRQVGEDPVASYQIVNSLSPELERFRQTLVPSLLAKVRPNLKVGYRDFALFELNQVARQGDLQSETDAEGATLQTPRLRQHLAVVALQDFYQVKATLQLLARKLQLQLEFAPVEATQDASAPQDTEAVQAAQAAENVQVAQAASESQGTEDAQANQDAMTCPPYLARQRSALVRVNGIVLGYLGEVALSVRRRFKLEAETVAAFELDLEKLLAAPRRRVQLSEAAKFPSVHRDLTLQVPVATPFGQVRAMLEQSLQAAISSGRSEQSEQQSTEQAPSVQSAAYRLSPTTIYQAAGSTSKNITFHLELLGQDHTYTSTEISAIMEKVNQDLGQQGVAVV